MLRWIDSIVRRVDVKRYSRKFTPRRDKSAWSEKNKMRGGGLMSEGRMSKTGLTSVREAKESGKWFEKKAGKELEVPQFVEEALAVNKRASENFDKLSPSYRRLLVGWVSKYEEGRNA